LRVRYRQPSRQCAGQEQDERAASHCRPQKLPQGIVRTKLAY
jgi:hypothetical protein